MKNLDKLFDRVFTQYVEDYENVADFSEKTPHCIAEDLEDKGFSKEEIETMVMAVVFSESPDDDHNTRYFLKNYEKYNPSLNCNLRDKFIAYGLDLLQPYDNLDELKRSVEENYEIDLDEEESQYLFKVYKNFFIDEGLEQDLDNVERE